VISKGRRSIEERIMYEEMQKYLYKTEDSIMQTTKSTARLLLICKIGSGLEFLEELGEGTETTVRDSLTDMSCPADLAGKMRGCTPVTTNNTVRHSTTQHDATLLQVITVWFLVENLTNVFSDMS